MSALRGLFVRLRSLLTPAAVERDLDEELRSHIEQETDRLIAGGAPRADAMITARRAFGNVGYLKEQSRDARGVRIVENVRRDLAYSVRLARRQPLFAAVVVLSLAFGLGAATAVFNLTNNVLFATLAVPRPAELAMLARVSGKDRSTAFSREEVRAIRARPDLGTFSAMRSASQIAIELGTRREYVNMQFVDGAFFSMIGLAPGRGRYIMPADDDQHMPVAVLSAAFAERLAPGDSNLVGKTITIRGAPFTVIGVMAPSFHGLDFPAQSTITIPLTSVPLLDRAGHRGDDRGIPFDPSADPAGRVRALRIVGRATSDHAALGAAIGQTLERCCANGAATAADRIDVVDIRRGITSSKDDFRGPLGAILLILLAGMTLLVIVVCCNVASLLVVRVSARAREIAVRLSLGASRARLVTQLVLETLPLALLGGVGGVLIAGWATRALVHAVPEWDAYIDLVAFHPAGSVLLFAAAATILCALGFSAYPAIRATRRGLSDSLRIDARASRTKRQGMVARGVVVAQVAFAVVLVTTATLMTLTLRNLRQVDGGFAVDRVLLMSLETRGTSYEQRGTEPIHQDVLASVRAAPGVSAAAAASLVPLFGGALGYVTMDVPGYVRARGERDISVLYVAVTPGYFAAIGIPLRSGREFGAEESARGAPAAIVSAALARRYFGSADPVGKSLRLNLRGDSLTPVRVVGVAADAKHADLKAEPEPIVFLPFAQTAETWSGLQIVMRTRAEPTSVAAGVMRAIDAAAPGVRVRRVSDMRARVDVAVSLQRLAAQLAAFAGAMVLALCAVGLYGVVSYGVARRTNELGIRMALGAGAPAIVWLVVRETARVVGTGVGAGLALSFAAGGVIASQLFGVGGRDPVVMLFSVLVFTVVALVGCAVPASRAARIDPCVALAAD